MTAEKWTIYVSGYGTFEVEGTEAEAEVARAEKARWERAAAYKYRSDLSRKSDVLTAQMVELFRKGKGVPYKIYSGISRAKKREAAEPPHDLRLTDRAGVRCSR